MWTTRMPPVRVSTGCSTLVKRIRSLVVVRINCRCGRRSTRTNGLSTENRSPCWSTMPSWLRFGGRKSCLTCSRQSLPFHLWWFTRWWVVNKKKKNLNNDQSQPSSVCWSAKTKDPKRQQEKNKKKRNPKVFFLTNTHSLFTLLLTAVPRRSRH
jgi:hypothetical protein